MVEKKNVQNLQFKRKEVLYSSNLYTSANLNNTYTVKCLLKNIVI